MHLDKYRYERHLQRAIAIDTTIDTTQSAIPRNSGQPTAKKSA
jgi:hypothetical protein